MGLFARRKTAQPAQPNPWADLVEAQNRQAESAPESGPVARQMSHPEPEVPAGSRGGRPVASEPRTKRVSLSLTEAEHAAWTKAAGGQRLSVWAREQVQAQQEAAQPNAGKAAELARLRADLARVGSNLNQLIRAVNRGEVVSAPELTEAVNGLWRELTLVRRDLP